MADEEINWMQESGGSKRSKRKKSTHTELFFQEFGSEIKHYIHHYVKEELDKAESHVNLLVRQYSRELTPYKVLAAGCLTATIIMAFVTFSLFNSVSSLEAENAELKTMVDERVQLALGDTITTQNNAIDLNSKTTSLSLTNFTTKISEVDNVNKTRYDELLDRLESLEWDSKLKDSRWDTYFQKELKK